MGSTNTGQNDGGLFPSENSPTNPEGIIPKLDLTKAEPEWVRLGELLELTYLIELTRGRGKAPKLLIYGAGDGDRTRDVQLGSLASVVK